MVAGGQESHEPVAACAYLRAGEKMGDFAMVDTMIKDGLWDAFNGYHMGTTAENVAKQWQITREQQDEFAAALAEQGGSRHRRPAASRTRSRRSRSRPARATSSSIPTNISATAPPIEAMARLRPAFSKDGTVTAGNASGINDGAAALVLMSAEGCRRPGLTPLARIASWAQAGVDPSIMGIGPDPGLARSAGKGRLEDRGSRPDRSQ